MGVLTALARPLADVGRGPFDDFWYTAQSQATAAGMKVSPDSAMRLSAVWACVSLISDTIASLPLHLYRRVGEDRERATDHPLYRLLHDQPNEWQTSMEFRQGRKIAELLRGNSYSYRWPDGRGGDEQLLPLHPDCVRPEKVRVATAPNGMPVFGLRYRVRMLDGTEQVMLADEIYHGRGLSFDGLIGVSVIDYARQSVGTTAALEEYAGRFFGNGARPGGILAPKQNLSQPALDQLKAAWNERFQGPANSHRIAALPVDVTYTAIGLTNEDSQFLESREHQVRDIARWFRVPLHLIGETTKETSWGSGIEQMGIGFVVYVLRPWLVRDEQAIKRDLIADDDLYAEHDVGGLLRGDAKSQAEALQLARQNGIINGEFWARLMNWPVPEGVAGTAYWRPANMIDANAAALAPPVPSPALRREAATAHHLLLLRDAAGRIVRKELSAMTRAAQRHADDLAGWHAAVREFYAEHAVYVGQTLRISNERATSYVESQCDALLVGGVLAMSDWETRIVDELVQIALGNSDAVA